MTRSLKHVAAVLLALVAVVSGQDAANQRGKLKPTAMDLVEQRFDRTAPQVGDSLPDVTAFDAAGNEFPLRNLRGSYTVLTFGCLT